MFKRVLGISLFVPLVLASGLSAQDLPLVSVGVGLTTLSGGPADASESTLRAIGFDDSRGSESMPSTYRALAPYIEVELGVSGKFGANIHLGKVRNHTLGHKNVPGAVTAAELETNHEILTTAFFAVYRLNEYVDILGGPAIFRKRLTLDPLSGSSLPPFEKTDVGWAAGTELTFINRLPYYGSVSIQYRHAGSLAIPETTVDLGDSAGKPFGTVVWPASSIGFSHWAFAVGGGFYIP